jgi:hypothetical protein
LFPLAIVLDNSKGYEELENAKVPRGKHHNKTENKTTVSLHLKRNWLKKPEITV